MSEREGDRGSLSPRHRELLAAIEDIVGGKSHAQAEPDTLAGFCALVAAGAPAVEDEFRAKLRARLHREMYGASGRQVRQRAQTGLPIAGGPASVTGPAGSRPGTNGSSAPPQAPARPLMPIGGLAKRRWLTSLVAAALLLFLLAGMDALLRSRNGPGNATRTATAVAAIGGEGTHSPTATGSPSALAAAVVPTMRLPLSPSPANVSATAVPLPVATGGALLTPTTGAADMPTQEPAFAPSPGVFATGTAAARGANPGCGSWSIVASPDVGAGNELHAVAAISASDVWAVGFFSRNYVLDSPIPTAMQTLIEHWDGRGWKVVLSPNVGDRNNRLLGVAAVSGSYVWAVGYYGDDNDYRVEAKPKTLTLHWDGAQWMVVASPDVQGEGSRLSAVAAISAGDVWTVGSSGGDLPANTVAPTKSKNMVLHWDGVRWSQVSVPNPGVYFNALTALAAISSTDFWAVGGFGNIPPQHVGVHPVSEPLMLHWDGKSWSQSYAAPGAGLLAGVAAESANSVWAVGSDYAPEDVENRARARALHWNGASWEAVPVPTPSDESQDGLRTDWLAGAAARDPQDVWAVGSYSPVIGATPAAGAGPMNSLVLHALAPGFAEVVPSPNGAITAYAGNQNQLNGIATLWEGEAWAVGSTRFIASSKTLIMRYTRPGCGGTPSPAPGSTTAPTGIASGAPARG